jgi:hypothetical protein
MPSAFEHGPSITVPSSNTTAKAAAIWSAASTLAESTIILDSGGNGRIGIAGDLDTITITSGTVTVAGTVAATTLTGAGAGITALAAANITASGTLPALNGAALTALTAANITASGTLPALNGAALTALNGTQVTSGTLPAARIGDDSIVEAKLDVSNGPTNGLFLQAQSGEGGGLTWAAAGATAPLQLASGSAGTPTYGFSSDVDTGLYMISSGNLGFSIAGTERVRINSNGGLFIGDTSHAATGGGCIVSKQTDNNGAHFVLKGAGTTIDHGMTTLPNQNTDCEVDDYLIIQPNHNTKGGVYNLALGEDTAVAWVLETITQGQDTSRSTSTSGFITFNCRMHDGSNGNYSSSMSSEAAGFVIKNDGTSQFIFNVSGNGYANTGWSTFSDGRLKLNQAEVPYGLATVMQMQPKIYDKHSGSFDDDGNVVLSETKQRMLGFVAQEIKALAPELVTDINEDDSFYGLDNGRIVPILVKAIQELNAKVDALTE